LKNCVGVSTDGCSVMSSKICGAIVNYSKWNSRSYLMSNVYAKNKINKITTY
jgi:hypothetical protein